MGVKKKPSHFEKKAQVRHLAPTQSINKWRKSSDLRDVENSRFANRLFQIEILLSLVGLVLTFCGMYFEAVLVFAVATIVLILGAVAYQLSNLVKKSKPQNTNVTVLVGKADANKKSEAM